MSAHTCLVQVIGATELVDAVSEGASGVGACALNLLHATNRCLREIRLLELLCIAMGILAVCSSFALSLLPELAELGFVKYFLQPTFFRHSLFGHGGGGIDHHNICAADFKC